MKSILKLAMMLGIVLASGRSHAQVWERIMDIPQTGLTALEVIDGTIYTASGKNLYRSADGGHTWAHSQFTNQNDIWVSCFIKFNGKIYAGTSKGIFSANQNAVSGQWSHDLQTENINSFTVHDNVMYASVEVFGILRFNGFGWMPFNSGLPSYAMSVTKILSAPAGLLAIAGANGAFYRFDFNQGAWIEDYYSDGGLMPGIDMDDIISVGNTLYVSRYNTIYRSDDLGQNWVQDKQGILAGQTRTMYATPTALYNVTMIGTNMGGFNKRAANAQGTDWSVNTSIAPSLTYAVREINGVLFLATAKGLYTHENALGNANKTKSVITVYPNPSRGRFMVDGAPVESIKVYDTSGRAVLHAADARGLSEFTLDNPGFYVVELVSAGIVVNKKVVVN